MLDVSIRIGLLNVMSELRDDEGVSMLYITHDLASARYVADRMIVLYAGRIVEEGDDRGGHRLAPSHPYTRLLMATAPDPRLPLAHDTDVEDLGEPPKVIDPGPGVPLRAALPAGAWTSAASPTRRRCSSRATTHGPPVTPSSNVDGPPASPAAPRRRGA